MKNDFEILKEILGHFNYTEAYTDILTSMAFRRLDDSGLEEMTPNFLYYTFIHELGRHTASKIADYFQQMKDSGTFETELQRMLKNSPYIN